MLVLFGRWVLGVLLAAGALVGCAAAPPFSARLVDASGDALPTRKRDGIDVVIVKPGQSYEVFFENATNEQLGVIVQVDGLETTRGTSGVAPSESGGHLVSPWRNAQLRGFDTGPQTIATFRVTEPADAFATMLAAQVDEGRARADAPPVTLGRVDVDFFHVVVGAHVEPGQGAWSYVPAIDLVTATPGAGSGASEQTGAAGAVSAPPTRFGDTVPDRRETSDFHWTMQAPPVAHFTILYEGEAGQKLGTAGPPPRVVVRHPKAPPTQKPPSTVSNEVDEAPEVPAPPKGATSGGGKPVKAVKAVKAVPKPTKPSKDAPTPEAVKPGRADPVK